MRHFVSFIQNRVEFKLETPREPFTIRIQAFFISFPAICFRVVARTRRLPEQKRFPISRYLPRLHFYFLRRLCGRNCSGAVFAVPLLQEEVDFRRVPFDKSRQNAESESRDVEERINCWRMAVKLLRNNLWRKHCALESQCFRLFRQNPIFPPF